MEAYDALIVLFRSLEYYLIGVLVLVALPTFILEAKLQIIEFLADRREEKRRAQKDDDLFTGLVEINRKRPKKEPKHRLEDKTDNG
jgi:uncharacterized membrane protein